MHVRLVLIDASLALAIIAVGNRLFNQFEEMTPRWTRIRKMAVFVIIAALLAAMFGRPWSLVWVIGTPILGLGFHFWWCRSHQINPLTAEPRDRYHQLRGWKRGDAVIHS